MTSRKPGRRKKNEGDEEFKLTESQEEEEEEEESSDDSSSKPKGIGRPKPGRRGKKGGGSTASDDGGASDDGKQSVQRKQTTSRRKPRRQNTFVMSAAGGDVSGGAVKKVPKIVVRNPTKKTVVIHSKQIAQEGFLSPPKVRRVRSKKKAASRQKSKSSPKDDNKKEKGANKENENEFYEDIDLLSKLPLPSTYFRHRFNQNIATIGSINIQAFGTKKASSNVLMHIITDLLRRYDIVLCQEIHAPEDHEDVIEQLCEEVSTPSTPYSYVASKPLGRGKYVERYVYLYRTKEWKVLNQYVIDDDKLGDKFARDPFVVRFQHWRKPDVRINLVGCHTQPENAFEEVIALVEDVYDVVKSGIKPVTTRTSEKPVRTRAAGIEDEPLTAFQIFMNVFCCCLPKYAPVSTRDIPESTKETWKVPVQTTTEPIIMMGDFNAAGSYVNKSKRAELDAILQSKNLVWGIQNTTDTTVSDGSDAAYDRFIFEEQNERRWVGKTGVWRFDDGWLQGKDDTTLIKRAAKRVSDHYPIEFELKLV